MEEGFNQEIEAFEKWYSTLDESLSKKEAALAAWVHNKNLTGKVAIMGGLSHLNHRTIQHLADKLSGIDYILIEDHKLGETAMLNPETIMNGLREQSLNSPMSQNMNPNLSNSYVLNAIPQHELYMDDNSQDRTGRQKPTNFIDGKSPKRGKFKKRR